MKKLLILPLFLLYSIPSFAKQECIDRVKEVQVDENQLIVKGDGTSVVVFFVEDPARIALTQAQAAYITKSQFCKIPNLGPNKQARFRVNRN